MPSLRLRHVSVEFPIYRAGARSLKKVLISGSTIGNLARDAHDRLSVHALSDISLDISKGDRVAIIGANGAGKTTLLKVLTGIYKPTQGRVDISGRVMTLLDRTVGLNHDATGRENIILRGMYMDIRPRDMRRHIDDVVEFSGLGSYLDMPVRTYSSGMMIRLAFAISTCIQPEILILDEWLAAGDREFLARAQQRTEEFINRSSIVVLASHSLELVRRWCRRAVFLQQGMVEAIGPVEEVIDRYIAATAPIGNATSSALASKQ